MDIDWNECTGFPYDDEYEDELSTEEQGIEMDEVSCLETKVLVAIMNDNFDEAERLLTEMYPNELVSLGIWGRRLARFAGRELERRSEIERGQKR